ncbi:hypothetical protein [Rhodospira trueperi]|uniref:Tat (Twin-arginine translocation) pathway signal sequence n=1 Tax=Rhodospira trueperi TaxID=69960 RepID=A0A1G7BER2_9PROT|nr:hypothetical protein [Rhodospira trueperi]SDE25539.1 hypothetical protein SAMN05421720_1054 [Rhodospira trueperi]
MADSRHTTPPPRGATHSRRALLKTGALAVGAAAVPAVALAAPYSDAVPPDMDGLAVMQIEGRHILVDLFRAPTPGDNVVALVPTLGTRDRSLQVFKAQGRSVDYALPHGSRTVWRTDRWYEAVGVIVEGVRHA